MVRALLGAAALVCAASAHGFCGFYVGRADASLFNDASKVIFTRDGARSTITMLNDYKGDLREFAMVVPVPAVLGKDDIRIGDKRIFDRIDAYTAPRLAEYFDPDPCARTRMEMLAKRDGLLAAPASAPVRQNKALGVTVEATHQIGEYDIVILSATQSNGLEKWLRANGYRIPKGAAKALRPYVRQGLKFFVAKVNLAEQAKTGDAFLRPLQFSFDYERFGLPIRLGMINARGPQDLVLYVLTKSGRVEATNYPTLKLPANMDVPTYVRGEFPAFYKALFDHQAGREAHRVVFTEYFWDMSWCDPCAADPLSREELQAAGAGWATGAGQAQPVMVTRLHVRYTKETFPEDLMFQETKDRANYQTRYVLRHPWRGDPAACPEAQAYLDTVAAREQREARTLADLTGQDVEAIRRRMKAAGNVAPAQGRTP